MRAALKWVVVVIAAGIAGCGGTASEQTKSPEPDLVPVTAELLSEGRRAYRKYCVQCHGFGGKGDGVSAAALDPPPRDHTDATIMDGVSDDSIAATVRYGGAASGYPNMPAFPHVAREELVALVAYVRSLSSPEITTVDIGDMN